MSKLIPQKTIDAVRNMVDVALDIVGIDCTLYVPTNTSYDIANKLDVWAESTDYTYLSYSAKVFIEWKPNTHKLKGLGLFVEGQLPILARFGNKATALEGSLIGTVVDIDISIHSYFRIAPEFIPDNYLGIEDFEVVNIVADQMHDSVLTKYYSIAPRRIQR